MVQRRLRENDGRRRTISTANEFLSMGRAHKLPRERAAQRSSRQRRAVPDERDPCSANRMKAAQVRLAAPASPSRSGTRCPLSYEIEVSIVEDAASAGKRCARDARASTPRPARRTLARISAAFSLASSLIKSAIWRIWRSTSAILRWREGKTSVRRGVGGVSDEVERLRRAARALLAILRRLALQAEKFPPAMVRSAFQRT
jgi:hypothetical protein